MENPVLVEVLRGGRVESRHRGAVAVTGADGSPVMTIGDVDTPIFPRSVVKLIQALALIESGAADRYALTSEELALACASHSGEEGHIATAERMLSRIGLDADALECGAHWPLHKPAEHALVRARKEPTALHNNCSGKHAGFLCVARAMGVPHQNYVEASHPVQREVKAGLESTIGVPLDDYGIDGCSIPTFAVPLRRLAHAFARLGTGLDLGRERAKAAARLLDACLAHPWHVDGTGRFSSKVTELMGRRVFVKPGAEGVIGAILPELGLGAAVKCDDGSMRATEVILTTLLARLLPRGGDEEAALEPLIRPSLRNWRGSLVGCMRPTAILSGT
jgi:L-asparaginase II